MTLGMFSDGGIAGTGADVQLFESAEFGSVRVVVKDGEPWFVASDVCFALGIGNITEALRNMEEDEKDEFSITDVIGRRQLSKIVSEAGLYSLVLRSRKPEAKSFKRWITHDVLPSIRKAGGYSVLPTKADVERLVGDPDFLILLLTEIKAERAKSAKLEAKARYHDNVLNSDGLYNVTQIAKDYGRSAKKFNRLLAEMGIQYQFKRGGQWFLYAKYQDKGYTKSVTVPVGNRKSATQTKWTEKGREFLYYELAKRGMYPTRASSLSPADDRAASLARLEAGSGPAVSTGLLEAGE